MLILSDLSIPNGLYLRNPLQSKLGKKIITHSILLFDGIGFEAFTFKKLAKEIESNEASIYRYFENKHLLLLFLVIWYWNWVSYLIDYNTKNIDDVNEKVLHRIMITESSKAYHTKSVDEENKDGFYLGYKNLIQKIADVILEIDNKFPYPHSFASNLFEMANNEIYFAEHLPRLTDIKVENQNYDQVAKLLKFYKDGLVNKARR